MSLIKQQLNNNLQVEQLQEDIICIMESHFPNQNVDEVIELLCDAVTYTFIEGNDTPFCSPVGINE